MTLPADPHSDDVPSPCVNVCRMDAATGLCEGCLRSLDEIAAWTLLDGDERRAVLARIELRRAAAADAAAPTQTARKVA